MEAKFVDPTIEEITNCSRCGFCNNPHIEIKERQYSATDSSYYLFCSNCYARGPQEKSIKEAREMWEVGFGRNEG